MHTPGPTTFIPADGTGRLDGWESVCSCGLRIANTIQTNVTLEIREHAEWAVAKAARQMGISPAERDRIRGGRA